MRSRIATVGRNLVEWRQELYVLLMIAAFPVRQPWLFIVALLVLLLDGPPDRAFPPYPKKQDPGPLV